MSGKLFECEITEDDELVMRFHMPAFRRVLPETRSHFVAARKETLLAIRSLVDAALERMPEEPKTVKQTITVE